MQIATNHVGGSTSVGHSCMSRPLTLSTASAQLVLKDNLRIEQVYLEEFPKSIYAYIMIFIQTYMHINMTHYHWSEENQLCHINLPSIPIIYHNCTQIIRMNFSSQFF